MRDYQPTNGLGNKRKQHDHDKRRNPNRNKQHDPKEFGDFHFPAPRFVYIPTA
jgi:hypothetical protein